jgi:hypothetical protein
MDWDTITKVFGGIVIPALAGTKYLNRKGRVRSHVRDNIEILERVENNVILRQHTPAAGWLVGKIAVDIARLTGQTLGPKKKPMDRGSAFAAALFTVGFGLGTYWIARDGWNWWAVLPGTVAVLLLIAFLGHFTNRELPDDPNLPPGAIPVAAATGADRVTTAAQYAASGADPSLVAEGGQASVAQNFIEALHSGDFEAALPYAEVNWFRCRVQSRLWNMYREGTLALDVLEPLTESLVTAREPAEFWKGFTQAEGEQFAEALAPFEPGRIGLASRRRRIARDYDLVILALLPKNGEGFMVTEPTMLNNAQTLLMHKVDDVWLVASHVATAPPVPGLPPTWWAQGDTAFQDLEES